MIRWVFVALVALVFLVLLGFEWLLEAPFYLAIGWAMFLYRVAGEVTIDWPTAAMAIAALALFAFGLHRFLGWLHRSILRKSGGDSEASRAGRPWRLSWSMSIVAILIAMFTAGVSAVGVTHQVTWWLVSPAPTFEVNSLRGAAARNYARNQCTIIGVGLSNHAEAERQLLPGATASAQGELLHSWQTLLLPYVEEQALFDQIDLTAPWNSEENSPATKVELDFYQAPMRTYGLRQMADSQGYPLTDYSANERVMGGTTAMKPDEVTDGLSHTILFGEATSRRSPWSRPGNWRDPARGINKSPDGFGAPWPPGGANFSMGDGSVRFLTDDIDPAVLRALATPAGGDDIANDF